MWRVAAWGALAEASQSIFSAGDSDVPPSPSDLPNSPTSHILAVSGRNSFTPLIRRPRRRDFFLPVLVASCTALIFLVLVCLRNLKDASGSLARGAFARSLAIGGTGGDCGDGGGDSISPIITAAERQLEVLSTLQASSKRLKYEEGLRIYEARERLMSEMAALRRDKLRRRKLLDQAEKTQDEAVRAVLQKDINKVQQTLEERKQLLKSMGYVEQQRVRALVTMAESWCQAREISAEAAAAVAASWRVTQPSKKVPKDIKSTERITVRRFVGIVINRGHIHSLKVQSSPSPSPELLTSAREFLETARKVVDLLKAAKMKREARCVEEMCESLTSHLDPSAVAQPRLRSTLSLSSIVSAFSHLHAPFRRSSASTPGDPPRSPPFQGQPRRASDTATDVDGSPLLTPSLTPSSPASSETDDSVFEDATPEPLLSGEPELVRLENWNYEANQRLVLEDPGTMASEAVASLEALWIDGSRRLAKAQKVKTDPGTEDDIFKAKVIKTCKYLLQEIPLFLSVNWIKQLSESKQELEEAHRLFKEALMDISPDSAPPAGSSVLQNMMQLRAAIAASTDLVARLKAFHTSSPGPLRLLSIIAGELGEAAYGSAEDLRAAGARVAKSWTNKVLAVMPKTAPQSVTPPSGLDTSRPIDSVVSQARDVLHQLLTAGFKSREVYELEFIVHSAGAP